MRKTLTASVLALVTGLLMMLGLSPVTAAPTALPIAATSFVTSDKSIDPSFYVTGRCSKTNMSTTVYGNVSNWNLSNGYQRYHMSMTSSFWQKPSGIWFNGLKISSGGEVYKDVYPAYTSNNITFYWNDNSLYCTVTL